MRSAMHTRAHLGRAPGPRATSRLEVLLDAMDQASVHRPYPGYRRKYRQRSHWKSILRRIIKEGVSADGEPPLVAGVIGAGLTDASVPGFVLRV